MSEMTLHTGAMGNFFTLNIDWSDHNNVKQKTKMEICVINRDKPRAIRFILNGVNLAEVESEH